jgi:polyisoprenoid-binding protein YceI
MSRLLRAAAFAMFFAAAPAGAEEVPGKVDASRVTAGTYKVDTSHTQVVFEVNHFGFNAYHGLLGGATGTLTLDPAKPEGAKLAIEIPLKEVVTTSTELNAHLAKDDFFDVAKHPVATFTSTKIDVSGEKATITGDLTLRGVTKSVVLDAEFTGAGENPMNKALTAGFEATTTLKRSDFGIDYALPLVSDEVDLRVTVAFEKE